MILHGLSTFGFGARAVVAAVGGGDPAALRLFGVRFTAPVKPGEALETAIWEVGPAAAPGHAGETEVAFVTRNVATGKVRRALRGWERVLRRGTGLPRGWDRVREEGGEKQALIGTGDGSVGYDAFFQLSRLVSSARMDWRLMDLCDLSLDNPWRAINQSSIIVHTKKGRPEQMLVRWPLMLHRACHADSYG